MKKTALTILLSAAAAFAATGQTPEDIWMFSRNNYEGTARSVAMGNAFTALGGDLGAVTINPAGSAVAGYSQFSITPSLTVSGTSAQGTLPPGSSSLPYFESKYRDYITKFNIPNMGFTFNYDTGRNSGLKRITLGFIVNRTNSWCEDAYAKGTNYTTSFAGAAASDATRNIAAYNNPEGMPAPDPRYSYKDFLNEDAYDFYSPWRDIVGYRSGIFSSYDDAGEEFIGATEIRFSNGDVQQGGPVFQEYGRSRHGHKYEYLFNVGADISDFIYLGFNLGVNTLTFDHTQYFKEKAIDAENFPNKFTDQNGNEETTYFRNLIYRTNYSVDGSGIFGKFGIIVTPGAGLRFGAAIQTATAYTVREQYQESAATEFSNSKFNGEADTPLGKGEYMFNSPFRANFGVAYTLGKLALFSADYEVTDFSGMRFKNDNPDYNELFDGMNQEIKDLYTTAHHFRLGTEFKPLSTVALRAGYNLMTSGERYSDNILSQSLALGLGYISDRSFFLDLACRYSFATKEYYMPYNDYQFNSLGEIVNYSPELMIINSNWKILLTLGWRF